MAISESKRDRNARYAAKHNSVTLRPPKSVGLEIREAAKLSGKSLQRYVIDALRDYMLKDGFPLGE